MQMIAHNHKLRHDMCLSKVYQRLGGMPIYVRANLSDDFGVKL